MKTESNIKPLENVVIELTSDGMCDVLLFANIPFERLWLTFLMGLPYVALQAVGNFALGTLIVPISRLLRKLDKRI